jgi:hypothetical protein
MVWITSDGGGHVVGDGDQHGAGIGTIMRAGGTYDSGIHANSGTEIICLICN